MIYSQACGYCLTALCRLRLLSAAGPVRVVELCRINEQAQEDLPAMFVAKIFQDLVRSGILKSTRGRNGGFIFARPPAKIKVADIVEAVDGIGGCRMCISGMPHCNESQPCPLHDRFAPIRKEILRFLQETTLENLSESLAVKMQTLGLSLIALREGEARAPSLAVPTLPVPEAKRVSLRQIKPAAPLKSPNPVNPKPAPKSKGSLR